VRTLRDILPTDPGEELLASFFQLDDEPLEERLTGLGKRVKHLAGCGFGYRILEDLTAIAFADGTLDNSERERLYRVAKMLDIWPFEVDYCLKEAEKAQEA